MKENVVQVTKRFEPILVKFYILVEFYVILYFGKIYIEITVAILNGNLSDASYPL